MQRLINGMECKCGGGGKGKMRKHKNLQRRWIAPQLLLQTTSPRHWTTFQLDYIALRHWGVEKLVFSLVSKRDLSASKVETVSSRDKDGVIGIWKRWQIYFQWIQKCSVDKQFSLIMERSCCFLSGNSVQQSDDDDDDDDYGDDDINVSNHAAVPFFLSSNLE